MEIVYRMVLREFLSSIFFRALVSIAISLDIHSSYVCLYWRPNFWLDGQEFPTDSNSLQTSSTLALFPTLRVTSLFK